MYTKQIISNQIKLYLVFKNRYYNFGTNMYLEIILKKCKKIISTPPTPTN